MILTVAVKVKNRENEALLILIVTTLVRDESTLLSKYRQKLEVHFEVKTLLNYEGHK